ncbi:MAG: hypothetical protein JSS30_00155 [Verrucomicrobia bacterium]|nr:hypothetical protein [Verrucomicrobiota bacterium]
MRYFKVIFSLLFTVQCVASLPYYERWLDNFDEAQEEAQKLHRPLLIAFELEGKSTVAHLSSLDGKVVFLRIAIPDIYEEDSQINRLREKYHIESCPTFILVEPNGHEIGKLDAPRADEIVTMLEDYSLVSKASLHSLKVDQLQALYAHAGKLADTTFKQALLEEGLKVDQGPYFLLEQYGGMLAKHGVKNRESKMLRNRIIARDLQNEKGCRRQLALMDFESLSKVGQTLTAKAVVKPLIDYLQKFGAKDPENAWQIELKISQYLFSRDQVEEALKHANASLKMAPASERQEIAKSVDYLKTLTLQ